MHEGEQPREPRHRLRVANVGLDSAHARAHRAEGALEQRNAALICPLTVRLHRTHRQLDEADRAKALETAQQMVGNLAFEFTPDGKMNLYMGDKIRNGTYEVLKASGDVITLKTSHGEGQTLEVEEVKVVVGDDTLKVTGEDSKQSLILERGPPGQNTVAPGTTAPGAAEPKAFDLAVCLAAEDKVDVDFDMV